MVRMYRRKTERQSWPEDSLWNAIDAIIKKEMLYHKAVTHTYGGEKSGSLSRKLSTNEE